MIIYNITAKVDHAIHNDWMEWMQAKHIPDVLNTGFFTDAKIFKVLQQNEADGFTYAIQYHCTSMTNYFSYQQNHAPQLQKEHKNRYQDKVLAFRTILKEIEVFTPS